MSKYDEQNTQVEEDNILFCSLKEKDWRKASVFVDHYANSRDPFGNTPLHTAIGYKAPDSIILSLIQRFPDACKIHGVDDWLPLHVAAMWGVSPTIMETLIRTFPDGLDDPGAKGKTPRHYSQLFPPATKELLDRSTTEWKSLLAKRSLDQANDNDNNNNNISINRSMEDDDDEVEMPSRKRGRTSTGRRISFGGHTTMIIERVL